MYKNLNTEVGIEMFIKLALEVFYLCPRKSVVWWRRNFFFKRVTGPSLNPLWTKLPETWEQNSTDSPEMGGRPHTGTHNAYSMKRVMKTIKCSSSHLNIQAVLCLVKEGLQFWSHRARSRFPHVNANANTQPWEQTCQEKKTLRLRFWAAERK